MLPEIHSRPRELPAFIYNFDAKQIIKEQIHIADLENGREYPGKFLV
jgi:hypothetical protein